jgi:hypothetical protein
MKYLAYVCLLFLFASCQSVQTGDSGVTKERHQSLVRSDRFEKRFVEKEEVLYRMDLKGMAHHSTIDGGMSERLQEHYEDKLYPDLGDWDVGSSPQARTRDDVFSLSPDEKYRGGDVDIYLLPQQP